MFRFLRDYRLLAQRGRQRMIEAGVEFLRDYRLLAQLPEEDEVPDHIEALQAMTRETQHKALFDHLYECLTILDSKSASLLSFNSIIIAVYAIFLTQELDLASSTVIGVGLASVIVSCFLLLFVVWVQWSGTEYLVKPDTHERTLLQVRKSRTILYRLAWYCVILSMLSLSLFLIVQVV